MSVMRIGHVRCHLSGMMLPGADRLGVFVAHRGTCLRCQAEAARQRRLDRQLRQLADVTVPAPVGITGAVMRRLDGPAASVRHEASGPRGWLVPAIAAAGCAMAVAVARRALFAA